MEYRRRHETEADMSMLGVVPREELLRDGIMPPVAALEDADIIIAELMRLVGGTTKLE